MISMSNNLFASTKWDDKTNSVCVYVDFKRWNGKIVPSIERRRKMGYLL